MYLPLLILSSLLILHAFALHHQGQPGTSYRECLSGQCVSNKLAVSQSHGTCVQGNTAAGCLQSHGTCVQGNTAAEGRRACGRGSLNKVPVVLHTESFVQPVHKPYITHCQGHRLCSTYKTLYRVAYRSVSRLTAVAHSYPECCPGWRRFHSHNCNQAVCAEACANGGTCFRPNQCACVSGWMGRSCQTDVDECSSSKLCSQTCLNTAGSYLCGCRVGYTLAEDGHSCQTLPASSLPDDSSNNSTGASNTPRGPDADTVNNMTEEVQLLKYKVQLLEEKLHQALAPFTSLFPLSLEQSVAERTSFLTQSFQQLERIDSLSEQIGFLEERLETCSCQDN